MTHPDPDFRKVGELPHFGTRLLLGKAGLFAALFFILALLGWLQAKGQIGTLGTYAMIALALAALLALMLWDFSPSRHCPECHARMKPSRVRPRMPSPPAEEAMILCCQRCKTYIDLQVSSE